MVQKILTRKDINEMCKWLEFYDKNGFLPFQKKRINFTIVGTAIQKLKKQKNKSKYIEKLILKN